MKFFRTNKKILISILSVAFAVNIAAPALHAVHPLRKKHVLQAQPAITPVITDIVKTAPVLPNNEIAVTPVVSPKAKLTKTLATHPLNALEQREKNYTPNVFVKTLGVIDSIINVPLKSRPMGWALEVCGLVGAPLTWAYNKTFAAGMWVISKRVKKQTFNSILRSMHITPEQFKTLPEAQQQMIVAHAEAAAQETANNITAMSFLITELPIVGGLFTAKIKNVITDGFVKIINPQATLNNIEAKEKEKIIIGGLLKKLCGNGNTVLPGMNAETATTYIMTGRKWAGKSYKVYRIVHDFAGALHLVNELTDNYHIKKGTLSLNNRLRKALTLAHATLKLISASLGIMKLLKADETLLTKISEYNKLLHIASWAIIKIVPEVLKIGDMFLDQKDSLAQIYNMANMDILENFKEDIDVENLFKESEANNIVAGNGTMPVPATLNVTQGA